MVQLTDALLTKPGEKKETGVVVPAKDYDSKIHGGMTCHCPDEDCKATLVRKGRKGEKGGYMQTFYSAVTGQPRRQEIQEHYQRRQASPEHRKDCTAVKQYAVKAYTGFKAPIAIDAGAPSVINLNIPTGNSFMPLRQGPQIRRSANLSFDADGAGHGKQASRVLSIGFNDVRMLAGKLNETQFDPAGRKNVTLRLGRKIYSLAEIFEENADALFRKLDGASASQPCLIRFQPIAIPKFNSAEKLTIMGQAKPLIDTNGERYSTSMMLRCGSKDIYDAITKATRKGDRSFLIYTESAYVDEQKTAAKKAHVQAGRAHDRTLISEIPVKTMAQFCAWAPNDLLTGAGLKLPVQSHPKNTGLATPAQRTTAVQPTLL